MIIGLAKFDWLTASKHDAIISKKIKDNELLDVFIYVHWSKELKPSPGEVELLTQASNAGLQNLLVLNADSILKANQAVPEWDGLCSGVIIRKNIGRDLAGYRAAIRILDESKVKRVFFFNNSIIWLPSRMKNFIEKFISINEDIYSATVSYQPTKHMQSFAMAAKNQGIPIFLDQMNQIRNTRSKRATISFGEIGISRNLTKLGVNFSSGLFSYSGLIMEALNRTNFLSQPTRIINRGIEARLEIIRGAVANGTPLNPTHHTWFELYTLGFPGLKKDLFTKNKSRIPDLVVLEEYFDELDKSMIDFEKIGFITFSKSWVERIRRKIGL